MPARSLPPGLRLIAVRPLRWDGGQFQTRRLDASRNAAAAAVQKHCEDSLRSDLRSSIVSDAMRACRADGPCCACA
eukprot:15456150-Alexandrium_andersonii.AAC.1